MKKIRKQAILLLTTIVFAMLLCGAVSAADSQGGNGKNSTELPKIAYISSYPNEIPIVNKLSTDPDISNKINVTSYSGRTGDISDIKNYDLSKQKVIVLRGLTPTVLDELKNTVLEAKNNGAYIIENANTYTPYNNVNLQDPEYSNIEKYLLYASEGNLKQLLLFLGVKFCNCNAEVLPPVLRPIYGIYHPDTPEIFTSSTDYLNWYSSTGKYNASNPTVGIITSKYTDMTRDSPLLDALIESFELKNVNVIVSTYTPNDPNPSIDYLMKEGRSLVDAIIVVSMGATLNYNNQSAGIEDLKKLNVPVINGIRLFTSSVEDWESSPYGVPPAELYQITYAETDGIIEPIVISGKETDPETGLQYNKPIDYQIAWLTERTISWMKLHRMDNWEKKIVIPYYSEGGGKANVGADIDYYLDTPASLAKLLVAMKDRGYNVGSDPLPDATELAKLMAQIGSNIGTWAPGELKKRVQSGNVILIPESLYLQWFNEISADKQAEMIKQWGLAPGKLMVYEDKTGKYIVIPKIQYGNILLVPEPVWGWLQDNSTLYNTGNLPPTHDCLAFYFWINRVYKADAIFSIFSIVELMPGKQVGLSAHDWGAILLQDMPLIHVLPMDAEGIFDRRRANMLIIDFLTPILIPSGLYGDLADLDQDISLYNSAVDSTLKSGYKDDIIKKCKELGLEQDLNVNLGNISNDTSLFETFLGSLKGYLQELKTTYMPYGSHTLSEPPTGDVLVAMIEAMLGDDFHDRVTLINPSTGTTTTLLSELLINNLSPEDAQNKVLKTVSSDITNDLKLALDYSNRIAECTNEIPRILDALEGKYILPGPNGDPIRNPDALPTGRDLHTFESRIIPTKQAWETGQTLVNQLLTEQLDKTGTYPQKVAFVLWAIETSRHQGIMESEILYLLGVKPVWDSKGRVKDVELINSTELKRPRIDVVITVSGIYRDMYSDLIKLLDKAVRLAAQSNDKEYPNYVKEHSETLYQILISEEYSESDAKSLSMSRIFADPPGSYTPGIQEVIPASNTWEDTNEVADFYLERMSYIYGNEVWGEQLTNLFKQNLNGVEICEFSRTSNVYGVLDHPMVAAYLGGLAMAIERVSGKTPDTYISNLRESNSPKLETLSQFLNRDLRTRYLNPKWIEGMMEHGHDGTRYMDTFIEDLWMWDVTNPDLITENTWNDVYDVYVKDKYNLGLKEYFNTNNPYAKQSILARMVETVRKGYWNPPADVKTQIANEYIQSVIKYGVTCCHHTCANVDLSQFMVMGSSLSRAQLQQFADAFEGATGKTIKIPGTSGGQTTNPDQGNNPSPGSTPTPGSTSTVSPGEVNTVQAASEAGQSSDSNSQNAHEISEVNQQNSGQSNTPLIAIIGVILLLCLVGVGYFRNDLRNFLKK